MMRITKLHYFPFNVETYIPWNEQTIQSFTFELNIEKVASNQMNLVLGALTYRLCKGRFEKNAIYLRAELDNGAKILMVDGRGRVQLGRDEYFILPSSYLWLNDTLRRLMLEQNPGFPSPSRK